MHIGINDGGIAFNDGAVGGCACCGGGPPFSCVNPSLNVTMSWTGGGTETFLGETFTNGQTHKICPSTYQCTNNYTTTNKSGYRRELWIKGSTLNAYGDMIVHENNNGALTTVTNADTFIRNFAMAWNLYVTSYGPRVFDDRHIDNRIKWSLGTTNPTAPRFNSAYYLKNQERLVVDWYVTTSILFSTYTWQWYDGQVTPTDQFQSIGKIGITDDYNGTYTTGRGITVTWSRGTDGDLAWGACF